MTGATAPRPRIVVLDGHTLNPGDLGWDALAELGELTVHARTSPEEVLPRCQGAGCVLTNKTVLDERHLGTLEDLRYVGVLATGTNVVDLDAARQNGVVVTNVPSYGTRSVAEHTVALMLESAKSLSRHLGAARAGAWSSCPDFSLTVAPIHCLSGRNLGIVGYGAIGRRVAELARAFGMNVLVARHRDDDEKRLPLDRVFAESDFVSLHCPLTPETTKLVDARRLSLMKAGSTLVNTARGGLVDEPALARALEVGRPARAYLDVLSREPPPADHPLLAVETCHVTPHVAWAAVEARRELMRVAVANVAAFRAGQATNVVT